VNTIIEFKVKCYLTLFFSNRYQLFDFIRPTFFVTMAKKYGVDEYAIKYMVGHKISDITEKVYTQREYEWLKTEIEKIE